MEAAPSGRRPALEALAYLALCGMLAAGALATLAALIAPHLEALTPYKPLILAAGGLGGGFNPSSQHLMISEVWDSSSSAGSRSGDTVKVEA
ncbi:hypothetical protein LUR56_40555 [Streptomyces sp. MT29]|nr:hypothetical protein [Streptomyces sp. MT29]